MKTIKIENESDSFELSLTEILQNCDQILKKLELINREKVLLHFLTVDDMIKITGFSKKKVLELFSDPEFPSCDFGKAQIAEVNAVIQYFSVPRKKEYSKYWRSLS